MALMLGALLVLSASSSVAQITAGEDLSIPDEPHQVETTVDGDEGELEGKRIASFTFDCDLHLCNDADPRRRFKEISGLSEGQIFGAERLERAQNRLAQTGFFRALHVERRLQEEGVHIHIDAQGAVLIRRIRFEGLRPPPFESELRKVLMFRSGQVFHEDEEQVHAQLRSLEALFEQESYFGSRIVMEARPVDDNPHLVDLVFEVERGDDRRICSMAFRGVRAMTSAEARELMLEGVSILARRVPLRLPRFTSEQFRSGREALIREYRQRGYFRARVVDQAVQIDDATNCVRLIVDVNEGPFWEIEFTGNNLVGATHLRDELPFANSGYVDDDEIRAAENAVRKTYESMGYPFAQVQGKEVVEDRLDRRLVFSVDEGPRAQIVSIDFEGVSAFQPSELLQGFGTQPFGLFESGGFLQTEQLLADLAGLEHRYRQRGYLQAVVERFEVRLTDDWDGLELLIVVDEGPQTTIDEVSLTGNEVVDTEELRQLLGIAAGDPFESLQIQADQSRLSRHYGSRGYPRAALQTECRSADGRPIACREPRLPEGCLRATLNALADQGCSFDETEGLLSCQRIVDEPHCRFDNGVTSPVVSVEHRINEGPVVRVGEILLKGNFRTRSGVIFRELGMERGELLDVQRLIEGQGNMRSLGIFDSVSVETIGLDDSLVDEDLDEEQTASLIVSVEESSSRYLDFRFGLEGRELLDDARRLLLTGETQYVDNNLFGAGQRFRPRLIGAVDTLDLYRLGADTTQELEAATDLRSLDFLLGAELIYNHPRFLRSQFGVDKLFLTVTPFYLIDLLGVDNERVRREEWGLRLEVRKELFELLERFYLTFGVEAKQAATWGPGDLRVGGERVFSPRRTTGKLIPEFTLDRRDSPLNPTKGYHLQFQPEIVSGDALSQDREEVIGDSYWRLSFAASLFTPLVDGLVLAQGFRGGQIVPLFDRQTLVPLDERYFLGGVGSVRGFAANTLGPIGDGLEGDGQRATGGEFLLNYTAEFRYPILAAWSLYGATFFDAGLLVNCLDDDRRRSSSQCLENAFPADAPLSQIRATAGLGLRYLLVDQIPLLFDYGMVLNRRPGEGFGSLHFNLGYTF